ncbi:hypothetical protein [Kitasatospora cathayae]|uniref:Uncharacterized protein n=1 Tax=Kitasatospora cathayae TaxID=3004092 RepID=A0ABY7QE75_9ACTN|nr:hypothetical protein [Kitasatospora sp. HUAS 3-15]WBP90851.1 hypothetical protein O1G21_36635 [Kitasatospora sp. HUAS 3-15]
MDCDGEVMLTVRIAAAERALLRDLARGHGGDVSGVAVDGLLEVIPALSDDGSVLPLLRVLARPAPCAVTLWLPAPVADLLPLLGERLVRTGGPATGSASAALSAALRLWLAGDRAVLAAGLARLHGGCGATGRAARSAVGGVARIEVAA